LNITFTVSFSTNGVELVQCFSSGGTTNATFELYFERLIKILLNKYKDKKFLIVLDNLWAHKTSLIIELMSKYKDVEMLLTPSNSPELNPVENLFCLVKGKLREMKMIHKN